MFSLLSAVIMAESEWIVKRLTIFYQNFEVNIFYFQKQKIEVGHHATKY